MTVTKKKILIFPADRSSEWIFHVLADGWNTWAKEGAEGCSSRNKAHKTKWDQMMSLVFGNKTHLQVIGRRRQWHPTPVLLPGKSHGQKSLVGCSPWGHTELDMTERLNFHFSLSCIGEGNGNPLQCSCLENPRDGGACWAAVYGVAQSRT